jgi:hypothetical protein
VWQAKAPPLFSSQASYHELGVLASFIEGYSGTIICDGYSAYDKIAGITSPIVRRMFGAIG